MTGMMMFGAVMKVVSDADESGKDAGEMVDSVEFWSVVGPQIFGAVALAFLVSTVLEVVRSGFKAVFVCFVQVCAFFWGGGARAVVLLRLALTSLAPCCLIFACLFPGRGDPG